MDDVQEQVEAAAPVVDAPAPVEAPEQPVEAQPPTTPPAKQGGGSEGGDVVQATVDEARTNNYVPYTRFSEVNKERREFKSELERLRQEREVWLSRQRTFDTYRDEQYRPPQYDEMDEDDPAVLARKATQAELQRFRTELATRDKAVDIRNSIDREVVASGFRDPERAKAMIERIVIADVRNGDMDPDVVAIARELRQQEVDLERSIAADYQGRKNSAAAQAARQVPPAPPVVPPPPERELKGVSSRTAYQRVMDKLRGG